MRRTSLVSSSFLATAMLLAVPADGPAASVTYTGTAASGKWSLPANWSSNSVPAAGDAVSVIQSGTRGITVELDVAYSGANSLNSLLVNAAGSGAMTLNSSKSLVISGTQIIGSGGKGAFNHNAGTHAVGGLLLAATGTSDLGTYVQKNGTLNVVDDVVLGGEGQGVFTLRKGSVNVGGDWVLASGTASQGSLTMNNGKLKILGSNVVGNGGVAYFTQDKGTSTQAALVVGQGVGSEGLVSLRGGKMTSGSAVIGAGGIGEFKQSGGTHTVQSNLLVGSAAGEGRYKLERGTLNVSGDLLVGGFGTGEFLQSGGKVTTVGNLVVSNGSYSLTDATLSTNGITVGSAGSLVATGTATRIRITSDFLINETASVDLSGADLVIAKGGDVDFSVNGTLEDGLFLHKLTLERNISLTLDGDIESALVVDVIDLGSNSQFRLSSIIFGNGTDIYYNGDNEENRYLLGLRYDLGNGGQLIPYFAETEPAAASGTLSQSSFGVVPEPGAVFLVGSGLAALLLRRRARGSRS